jgi:hypothetical protein
MSVSEALKSVLDSELSNLVQGIDKNPTTQICRLTSEHTTPLGLVQSMASATPRARSSSHLTPTPLPWRHHAASVKLTSPHQSRP